MTIKEMNNEIKRVESFQKRGFLSVYEAESSITQLIESVLPEQPFTTKEAWEKRMEQRRLAYRRMWRFLLDVTKEKVRF